MDNEVESTASVYSQDEIVVQEYLARAWDAFVKLEPVFSDHQDEFRKAIHSAQYIIMSRPMIRNEQY